MLIVPTEDKLDWHQPPFVTIAIAFLCFAVFSTETDATITKYALIPSQMEWFQLVTHQYLHGDWLHLLGNLLFLLIFGSALEKHLGALNFFTLYLFTGVCSGWGFALLHTDSNTPLVGASGAISGLMGIYLAVYGWRRREYFAVLGPIVTSFRAPALVLLPVWLGYELLSAALSDDNVAYMAHAFGLMSGTAFYIIGSWCGLFHRRVQSSINQSDIEASAAPLTISAKAIKLENELRLVEALAVCRQQLKEQPTYEGLWYYAFTLAKRVSEAQIVALYRLLLAFQSDASVGFGWAYPIWQEHQSVLLGDSHLWTAKERIDLVYTLLIHNDHKPASHVITELVNSNLWSTDVATNAHASLLPLLITASAAHNAEAAAIRTILNAQPSSAPSD
ncbi:rhomboid family intramembrane serine protease [Corallincola spongiicola]|uniref:Rhomboid family intramembrane serine protease n=1 Tax=Corallincola spongiicola TaxID=2520508 RepID=A0ABY1WTW8_9GAMM|nr:rhomboid family intramembrane serine protease [Corallincola spongiicola]TAA48169.1 rhomboid family intramembrane serine protease [Corallincola spongiicola]